MRKLLVLLVLMATTMILSVPMASANQPPGKNAQINEMCVVYNLSFAQTILVTDAVLPCATVASVDYITYSRVLEAQLHYSWEVVSRSGDINDNTLYIINPKSPTTTTYYNCISKDYSLLGYSMRNM